MLLVMFSKVKSYELRPVVESFDPPEVRKSERNNPILGNECFSVHDLNLQVYIWSLFRPLVASVDCDVVTPTTSKSRVSFVSSFIGL